MKILLLGEYSRLHNSLKEGLIKNGHQVTLIGTGDYFKKFPVDINIDGKVIKNNSLLNKIRHLIYFLIRIDLAGIETYLRFKKEKKKLAGFDVIQLINETPFGIGSYLEKKLLQMIFKENKNVFLLACGDDYTFISYLMSKKFDHSTLTPLFKDSKLIKHYSYTLNCVSNSRKKLHFYLLKNLKAIIPVSVEYSQAYADVPKVTSMIPNPINIHKIRKSKPSGIYKIKIFHGINTSNYYKKGNRYFERALEYIGKKYANEVEIITCKDLPYQEYIQKLATADIVLDQVFAHDQGFNALEAMAMGKVVFTGAGQAFVSHYNLNHEVAINTVPDLDAIINNIERFILNPSLMITVGENAINFIQKAHHYELIARKYENIWEKYT